jgi:hypothetical protein
VKEEVSPVVAEKPKLTPPEAPIEPMPLGIVGLALILSVIPTAAPAELVDS